MEGMLPRAVNRLPIPTMDLLPAHTITGGLGGTDEAWAQGNTRSSRIRFCTSRH